MNADFLSKYLKFEESDKGLDWVNAIISEIRSGSRYLISKPDYDKNNKVFFGKISNEDISKMFKGAEMEKLRQKLSNSTVYFFEKVRAALVDERTSSGLSITVNSLDPEREMIKRKDKELLVNRKAIEAVLGEFTNNAGMPPITVEPKDFQGNIDEFDDAGQDEFNSTDLDNFFESKWGLKQEIFLQKPINAIARINQIQRNYDKYINDILTSLTVASRVYVDEVEGKVGIEYLKPHQVFVYGATGSNDFKDCQAIGVEKTANLRSIFKMFGNSIDLESDWQYLLSAIRNNSPNLVYSGIDFGDVCYGTNETAISFEDCLDAKVNYGYIEVKTINAKTSAKGKTNSGNAFSIPVKELKPEHGLPTETKYSEDTYRVYYLSTGGNSQKILRFGRLFLQPLEGLNDQYSNFSFKIYHRDGVPAAEIIRPYWEIIQASFQKFEMLIHDVKPDGFLYIYESLVKVAEYLQSSKDAPTDVKTDLNRVLEMYSNSPNRLVTIPTDDEGNLLGGGQFSAQKLQNGLNNAAVELMKIMDWAENKVSSYLATQGVELTEGGYKVSLENKKRTRAATAYIDNILLSHLEDIFITVLSYVQDISKYKDIPAYKYLEDLVGSEGMEVIRETKKAYHRFGLFLDTFNNDIELMELRALAQQDLVGGRITLEQYMVIRSCDSIKEALYSLVYSRKKAEDEAYKRQMSIVERQAQEDEKKFERQKAIEAIRGEWMRVVKREEAAGYSNAAAYNARAAITREEMKQQGQDARLAQKGINEIDKIREQINAEAQAPVKI